MAMFKGFKPQGLQKIANRMGYAGSMENFDNYLKQNPDKEREMIVYRQKAQQMAKGGVVNMQEGGVATQTNTPSSPSPAGQTIGATTIQRMYQPGVPQGGVTVASGIPQDASQMIQPNMGTVTGSVAVPTALATTAQASPIQEKQASTLQAQSAAPAVDSALSATEAAQTRVDDPRAKVIAAQQTASSVGNLQAAQGQATLIENPIQRQIQQG